MGYSRNTENAEENDWNQSLLGLWKIEVYSNQVNVESEEDPVKCDRKIYGSILTYSCLILPSITVVLKMSACIPTEGFLAQEGGE